MKLRNCSHNCTFFQLSVLVLPLFMLLPLLEVLQLLPAEVKKIFYNNIIVSLSRRSSFTIHSSFITLLLSKR